MYEIEISSEIPTDTILKFLTLGGCSGLCPRVVRSHSPDMLHESDTFLFVRSDLLLSYDNTLGTGSTATVYRGIVCNEGEVAVKVMHEHMDEDDKQRTLADLRQVTCVFLLALKSWCGPLI
jgi:hypothetical protein